MLKPYEFTRGRSPLLVSIPHAGTELTPEVEAGLSEVGRLLPDTDWHVPRLYGFLGELGANVLLGRYSRYVVDLNRPADDKPLYVTASTGLFPEVSFDGTPLFDRPPSAEHRAECLEQVWQPYHDRLADELQRLRDTFGYALLFDAHSIRSEIPRLFEGRLPELNLGTNAGRSCDPGLTERLAAVCAAAAGYSHVVNGRFKGGHITRHYGRLGAQVHAVQLELTQRCYMNEAPPYDYRPDLAARFQEVLRPLVETLIAWGREHYA
jgi:N-formylglutamate deformylase